MTDHRCGFRVGLALYEIIKGKYLLTLNSKDLGNASIAFLHNLISANFQHNRCF